MQLRVAVLTLCGSLAFAGSADSADAAQCLAGLRSALVAGGFSGSVDCQNDQLSVSYVGPLQKSGRTFEIYSYQYKLKPVCPECAIHSVQRIILMERGHYLGQYKLDFVRVTIRRGDLVFVRNDSASGKPVTVKFRRDGPPKQLWVDGEVIDFFR
jgi:hypothetical protein